MTLSIFSKEAWPQEKKKSTVDIPIRVGESSKYIERLRESGLDKVLVDFKPDICIFVQGSDPYEKDVNTNSRYMKLTLEQLKGA